MHAIHARDVKENNIRYVFPRQKKKKIIMASLDCTTEKGGACFKYVLACTVLFDRRPHVVEANVTQLCPAE